MGFRTDMDQYVTVVVLENHTISIYVKLLDYEPSSNAYFFIVVVS